MKFFYLLIAVVAAVAVQAAEDPKECEGVCRTVFARR
jgi:hypothetical protein